MCPSCRNNHRKTTQTLVTFAGNFALNSANPPHRLLRTLKMSSHTTHPGTVHRISLPSDEEFAPLVVAFEHGQPSHDPVQNTLIFLGGLFDGLLTVPYVPPVVKSLPLSWSLVEPILKSAYKQFGIASLGEDIAEIATLVEHFRSLRPGKIVLLGHSTGSQQIIHYLLSPSSPKIDGAIYARKRQRSRSHDERAIPLGLRGHLCTSSILRRRRQERGHTPLRCHKGHIPVCAYIREEMA